MALGWLLPDETNERAGAVRRALEAGAEAWIPLHWWLEVANGLLMAERRKRITSDGVVQAISLVNSLPFEQDEETAEQIPTRTIELSRKHALTIYDAAYLELALRRGAILATFDAQLLKAAAAEQIAIG